MTRLEDVQISRESKDIPPALEDMLMGVFGVTHEDLVEPYKPEKPRESNGPSMMNLMVLALLIFVVISGSTTFMVNNMVPNPYLLNAGHAVLIAFLYWVFSKVHN